jgi:hypothetical protein
MMVVTSRGERIEAAAATDPGLTPRKGSTEDVFSSTSSH